jgi:hypothetical protein
MQAHVVDACAVTYGLSGTFYGWLLCTVIRCTTHLSLNWSACIRCINVWHGSYTGTCSLTSFGVA